LGVDNLVEGFLAGWELRSRLRLIAGNHGGWVDERAEVVR
jgi:hypothetical protein